MPSPYRVSFQLYTAREAPSLDAVLEGLAAIGYDAVEAWPANYRDDAAGFRRRLDAAGLACLGFHLPFAELVEEPRRLMDVAGTLGDRPWMIPSFLPPTLRPTDVDGWKRIGELLARAAEIVARDGLRLAWHNHEFEFRLLPDGTRPIDHMLGAGDGVKLEIDFAWVTRGWADPVAEFERFADRIVAIQLKDTARAGTLDGENGWRVPGEGVVDWDALWPLFARSPADHLVVEHDRPADWRQVARRAHDFATRERAGPTGGKGKGTDKSNRRRGFGGGTVSAALSGQR